MLSPTRRLQGFGLLGEALRHIFCCIIVLRQATPKLWNTWNANCQELTNEHI